MELRFDVDGLKLSLRFKGFLLALVMIIYASSMSGELAHAHANFTSRLRKNKFYNVQKLYRFDKGHLVLLVSILYSV